MHSSDDHDADANSTGDVPKDQHGAPDGNDAASPTDEPARELWERRARTVVVHGAALTIFLVGLRIDKMTVLGVRPSVGEWLATLAPEVGLALLLEAGWLITVRARGAIAARLWLPSYVLFHLPVYVVVVTGQRFFYETLGQQKLSLILYALREFQTVQGVVSVGIDRTLFVLFLIALAAMVTAPVAYFFQRPWRAGRNVLIPAAMTVSGAGMIMWPTPESVVLVPLAGNFLTDLLPNPNIQQYLDRPVPTWHLYQAPTKLTRRVGNDTSPEDPQSTRQRTKGERPPNFLVVILESTRTDVLSAYGASSSKMPFIDDLARRSVVVDEAYTTVSHTTKALAGILCGMYPLIAMRLVESTPDQLPLRCLPELLGEVGYRTAFFQPAGNFEHRRTLTENMKYQKSFVPTRKDAGDHELSGYLGWEEKVMVEPAVEWITSGEKPYFATILTLSTHHPYYSPTGGRPRDMSVARGFYDKAATYVDGVLRELFEKLRDKGALDDTVVIVTGDHGEAFGERIGYRQHDLVPYESVTRVPLLLHHETRVGPPRRLGGLRQHIDVLPTVLELAGYTWDGRVPGRSLLSDPGHPWIPTSCWFSTYCLTARRGPLAYVFQFGRVPLQVYDVEKDPRQEHDIADGMEPAELERAIDMMLGFEASVQTYYQDQFRARAR